MITTQTYSAALMGRGPTNLGLRLRARIVARHMVGDRLLDVGCANGALLDLLRPRVRAAVGVDAAAADFTFPARGLAAAYAENLPFADDSFDTVLCSATRKHLRDPLRVAREMARVLCPHGRLIILDPNPLIVSLGVMAGKFDGRYIRHNSWSREICGEMHAAGLTVLHREDGLYVQCVARKAA